MEKEEFFDIMRKKSKKIDISLENRQFEKFYRYMELLLEWNQKINLTAITEPEEIILKHFIDSLTVSKYIEKNSKLIDVGTGAGFPGIPLKIVREDLEITLLDSLNKRVTFLNEIIDKLKLTKIETVHNRVEEFAQNKQYREKFDYSISRAVANMSTLSEYLIPLVKIGGNCICMKGSRIEEEINSSKNAINILGGKIENIEKFTLPNTDYERNIVIIKKEKATPLKYPRKAGTPAKNPII